MKKLDLRTLVMLLCVASMTVFASCDNKGNEPDDPAQGGQTDQGSGEETPTPADPYNGHAYVDLGLPSGLKWATCNVGATKPEEYGNYYAWGEVEPKEVYDWSTYFDTTDGGTTFLKYNNEGGKTTLDPEDDAASVNMGGSWRMPTSSEQDELRAECTWTWTDDYNGTGVAGSIVASRTNANSIFLPASGYRNGSDLNNAGSYGYCWSNSFSSYSSDYAYYLNFTSDNEGWNTRNRCSGLPVRGVKE